MLPSPPMSGQGTQDQTVHSSGQGQTAAMGVLVAPARSQQRRRLAQEGQLVYSKAQAHQLMHRMAQEGQVVRSQALAVVAIR